MRITFLPGNHALIEVGSPEAAAAVAGGALEAQENRRIANEVRARGSIAGGGWLVPVGGCKYQPKLNQNQRKRGSAGRGVSCKR